MRGPPGSHHLEDALKVFDEAIEIYAPLAEQHPQAYGQYVETAKSNRAKAQAAMDEIARQL